jgi:hypothetical protein
VLLVVLVVLVLLLSFWLSLLILIHPDSSRFIPFNSFPTRPAAPIPTRTFPT